MIRIESVVKRFQQPLLRGIDWRLERASVWGLIGPGASGKSVLLKLIAGLLAPDDGQIFVDGARITGADARANLPRARLKIGMLFQNNALFDFMTVLDNVAFPLLRSGVAPDEAEQRAAERLKAVGLSGSEHKLPAQLSGGMKKRVGVARAAVDQPPIVLYDEPTAGLDPVTTSKIYDLLRADQQREQTTVLVVSSDVDGLRSFAPQLAMLAGGELHYSGPTEAIEDSDDPVVRQFVRGELQGPL